MSEDFKKKSSDEKSEGPENRSENRHDSRPENKAAREVGSIDSTIMNLIAKKRTNSSSGSLDESQDHSLEIDFGGSVESRKHRLHSEVLAQAKEPTVFKPMPVPLPVPKHELPTPTPHLDLPKPMAVPLPHIEQPRPTPTPIPHIELPRPTPSLEVRRPSDALAPLADLTAPSDLTNNRAELKRLAADKIQNPNERVQFLKDIEQFETNFDKRSTKSATEKLREMANTYTQLSRLLSADSDILTKYPQCQLKEGETPWRVRVAEQIIHQAAEPFTISQGKLAVCAAASLEVREYYREPAAVARLVTDVLLTGNYEATAGGTKIDLTKCPDNLIPDPFSTQFTVEKEVKGKEIFVWNLPYSDARSFASQLFEVTAINLALQPRGFRYEQPTPKEYGTAQNKAIGKTVDIETHEVQPWGNGEKRAFCDADIASSAYNISGKDERHFVLTAASLSAEECRNYHLRAIYELGNRDQRVVTLFSPNELASALKKTQELGQWPPIVRLDASKPPVSYDGARAHFLVISAKSEDASHLAIDNTWSEKFDKNGLPKIPTELIADSMFSKGIAMPSTAANFRTNVVYAVTQKGRWSAQIEEWLQAPERLSNSGKHLSPAEYEKLHPSEELRKWIVAHPEDERLELWKKLLLEWRTKYPH